jgi:hypothetical protein
MEKLDYHARKKGISMHHKRIDLLRNRIPIIARASSPGGTMTNRTLTTRIMSGRSQTSTYVSQN